MLDMRTIREQPELVREALQKRQMDPSPVDRIITLDGERREIIQKVENMRSERNTVSKQIGRMKDKNERDAKIAARAPIITNAVKIPPTECARQASKTVEPRR